ncbi:MAG: hypothetical protein HYU67_00870 [Flavobacteriia bacterium]|nr:hypothetical protein [Flavobacteriia bacterium]
MNSLFSLLICLFIINFSFSQVEIKAYEEQHTFLNGTRSSIAVDIPFGDAQVVEKQLKKELKSWSGSFYINRGEYTIVQGKHSTLGTNTINVYAKILSNSDGNLKIVFAFDLGGIFLSSNEHAAQFKNMCKELEDFAKDCSVKSLENKIINEKEKLSNTRKNLKMLEKEKEKLILDIQQYKTFIVNAEKNLENNIRNQTKTFESIQHIEVNIDELETKKKKVKRY